MYIAMLVHDTCVCGGEGGGHFRCTLYIQFRHKLYIQGVSSIRSLSPCSYVCLSSMDDIIIMHCTCTVLYQGP